MQKETKGKPTQLEFEDTQSDKEISSWNREHSLWSENSYVPKAHRPPTWRDADKHCGMADNPLADTKRTLVDNLASILDREPDIREAVFRKLRSKHHETLEANANALDEIASHLAFCPAMIDTSTVETKKAALETILAEINNLQDEIRQNKAKATKLMVNAVLYAKQIGDRLLYVKCKLLKHGEYEDWVEENFDGGISTARAYTRIAKFENWKKIAPKAYAGRLTIEQALVLIRARQAEKEPVDSRRRGWLRMLTASFTRMIGSLSDKQLFNSAYDTGLMDILEMVAKRRSQAGANRPLTVSDEFENWLYLKNQEAGEAAMEELLEASLSNEAESTEHERNGISGNRMRQNGTSRIHRN